jgi:hypothetical protein
MSQTPTDQPRDEEVEINHLFNGIGERATPSTEALARAKAQSAEVWQEVVVQQRQQQKRKWRSTMAFAATGLLAIAAVMFLRVESTASWELELAMGQLEIQQSSTDREVSSLTAGTLATGTQQMLAGTQVLATENTRLHFASGAELRLAQSTSVKFLAADRFELLSGRVYIDTHNRADITVVTSIGEIADIGTQYSVTQAPDGLDVAVRSGSAVLTTSSKRYQADADPTSAGIIQVTTAGVVSQRQEPKSASRWDWIHTTHTGYSSHEVSQVLTQIAQDLGVALHYASVGDQATLANVTYAGDLSEMEPKQALKLVALSSGIRWTLDTAMLRVSIR